MSKTIVLKSCKDCPFFTEDSDGWIVGVCRNPKAQLSTGLIGSRQITTELWRVPFPPFCPL